MAFSYALDPPSNAKAQRTLSATICFAVGAVVGWPFALALAIPFVLEEIFVFGGDRVPPAVRTTWSLGRLRRFIGAAITAAIVFVRSFYNERLYALLTLTTDPCYRH